MSFPSLQPERRVRLAVFQRGSKTMNFRAPQLNLRSFSFLVTTWPPLEFSRGTRYIFRRSPQRVSGCSQEPLQGSSSTRIQSDTPQRATGASATRSSKLAVKGSKMPEERKVAKCRNGLQGWAQQISAVSAHSFQQWMCQTLREWVSRHESPQLGIEDICKWKCGDRSWYCTLKVLVGGKGHTRII